MSTISNTDHSARPNHAIDTATSQPESRASIRSTLDGIQRFKQSWISTLILKGGISLGQVITLIVLLALASTLSSPLYPNHKQSSPSEACPNPKLYQAWMGVQIGRLLICWGVSLWICLRRRRMEGGGDVDLEGRRGIQDDTDSTTMSALTSVSTLVLTPPLRTAPHVHSSDAMYRSTHDSSHSSPLPLEAQEQRVKDTSRGITRPIAAYSAGVATSAQSSMDVMSRAHDDSNSQLGVDGQRSLSAARRIIRDDNGVDVQNREGRRGLARYMDLIAPKLSTFLGLLSFILFILGNILLFKPLPSQELSCFHSSPLLWWGVMVVTGVGWFLLAQMIIVILLASLGGVVMVAFLRRFGVNVAPSEPTQPSKPDPLTLRELHTLKYVCYIPSPPQNTTTIRQEQLPHPTVYLNEDRNTCAICQETFIVPQIGKESLAEWLRELWCGHVYHAKCIDEWLIKGAATCPFCNKSVRDMISQTSAEQHSAANTVTGGRRESMINRWLRKESR